MTFSKEVGEVEYVDDFHPIATAIVGEVGSRALYSKIKTLVDNISPEDFEDGYLHGETTTNPTEYVLDVGSAGVDTWKPDVEIRWEYLEFDYRDPEPLELTVPLMVQARVSDIPELNEIERVPRSDIKIMRKFSREDQVHPVVVTICLDELPGGFEIADITLIN
jgi:hypothetical protein